MLAIAVLASALPSVFSPAGSSWIVSVGVGHAAESDAEQAAKEIADARERANAAADAVFEAESQLDTLEIAQRGLRAEISALENRIDELRSSVEAVAINRFVRSGTTSVPLLTGFGDFGDQARMDVLIDVANDTSADDFDEFDSLVLAVADKQAELTATEASTDAARIAFGQRREEALAEVDRLKDVEAQRLEDEAVRKALIAEESERRRQAEAQQRADIAAQLSPADGAQLVAPTITAQGTSNPVNPDEVASEGDIDDSAPTRVGTGGVGGGQTGTAGIGGRPGSAPGDLGGAAWICPVQGPAAFGDTWGAPRSGGRSHQGVDMIAARGLPVVAVVDGLAQQKVNNLGGNSVWLTGVDGNKYYYAHLDGWEAQGAVTAGTVIGYVGDTGNAKFSVPHLHFQIHPGGGAAVNPYPTTRAHC